MRKHLKIFKLIESIVDIITFTIFLVLFLIGGYAILDSKIIDTEAEIKEEVLEIAPRKEDQDFDFSELKAINPEIIAWLQIDNTNINFPVLQTDNNSKYLVRDYQDEYSTSGAIFVDYRNNQLLDDFTIIYGHRMDGSKMFGELGNFSEKSFFDNHTTGILYTEDATYDLQTISYLTLNIGTTTLYRLNNNRIGHNDEILQEALASAIVKRDNSNDSQKLIMLSTCNKDSKNYRDILLLSATKRNKKH